MEKLGNWFFKRRGEIPVLFLIAGLVVFIWFDVHGGYKYSNESYWYICLCISLFGLLIRIFTIGYTHNGTSGRNTNEGHVADELNRAGMYSLMRHPLYVGNFFMWLGLILLIKNVWFVFTIIFLFWIYYGCIILSEEKFLIHKYGIAFTNWSAVTPAIIPNFLKWKKPAMNFNFKKVLRQEKNGFAALFILFGLFYEIHCCATSKKFILEISFWSVAAAISSLLYLLLRFLKYRTHLLQNH
jgi:protein-S-isoprenylcysteine O-methyltransferase Ste14